MAGFPFKAVKLMGGLRSMLSNETVCSPGAENAFETMVAALGPMA